MSDVLGRVLDPLETLLSLLNRWNLQYTCNCCDSHLCAADPVLQVMQWAINIIHWYCMFGDNRLPVQSCSTEPYPARWQSLLRLIDPLRMGHCEVDRSLAFGHGGYFGRLPPSTHRWPFRLRYKPGESKALAEQHIAPMVTGDVLKQYPNLSLPWAVEAVPVVSDWDEAYSDLTPPFAARVKSESPRSIARDYRGRIVTRCTVMAVPARGDKFGRLVEDPTMDRLCDGLGVNYWQSYIATKTPHIKPIRCYVRKLRRVLKRRRDRKLCVSVCGWWADAKKAFYNCTLILCT